MINWRNFCKVKLEIDLNAYIISKKDIVNNMYYLVNTEVIKFKFTTKLFNNWSKLKLNHPV